VKYLQPSFTIYPAVKHNPFAFLKSGQVQKIDPKHQYTEIGGMCRFCALDRIGHNAQYGRKRK
jgi:hypothetical protein